MKSTSRRTSAFALLLITFTLLTSTALAHNNHKSGTERTASIQASANTIQQTIVTTEQNGALRSTKLHAFTNDNRALRSTPFAIPETTQHVVSVSNGFGNVIRKARIKRKGNVQG
jgi:hypothetical protein